MALLLPQLPAAAWPREAPSPPPIPIAEGYADAGAAVAGAKSLFTAVLLLSALGLGAALGDARLPPSCPLPPLPPSPHAPSPLRPVWASAADSGLCLSAAPRRPLNANIFSVDTGGFLAASLSTTCASARVHPHTPEHGSLETLRLSRRAPGRAAH